jgi:uncharacterized protein (TIGR02391 family)
MNLETRLEPRLWEAVRGSIEARQFTNAVQDAIHFLSDVIRERSGLEGDGVALIGQAFGGNSPKLKVNRLQSESDQNVQRGVEALLRGIYQAIRNPRSHGAITDDERDATAIVLFLDYLLRIVDKSKSPFSLPAFVARVLDSGFVPNERYAKLLVDEIPSSKRLLVCREVFARRNEATATKVNYFFQTILPLLTGDEFADLADLVSLELRESDDDDLIRFVLGAFPASFWLALSEVARLRAEHKLIQSVINGRYNKDKGKVSSGGLGTWATNILGEFTLKTELWQAVGDKLSSDDEAEKTYAFQWFASKAEYHLDAPVPRLKAAVLQGLRAGDERFRSLAQGWSWSMETGEDRAPEDPWRKPFMKALSDFKSAEPPMELEPESELTDDDIPF